MENVFEPEVALVFHIDRSSRPSAWDTGASRKTRDLKKSFEKEVAARIPWLGRALQARGGFHKDSSRKGRVS